MWPYPEFRPQRQSLASRCLQDRETGTSLQEVFHAKKCQKSVKRWCVEHNISVFSCFMCCFWFCWKSFILGTPDWLTDWLMNGRTDGLMDTRFFGHQSKKAVLVKQATSSSNSLAPKAPLLPDKPRFGTTEHMCFQVSNSDNLSRYKLVY